MRLKQFGLCHDLAEAGIARHFHAVAVAGAAAPVEVDLLAVWRDTALRRLGLGFQLETLGVAERPAVGIGAHAGQPPEVGASGRQLSRRGGLRNAAAIQHQIAEISLVRHLQAVGLRFEVFRPRELDRADRLLRVGTRCTRGWRLGPGLQHEAAQRVETFDAQRVDAARSQVPVAVGQAGQAHVFACRHTLVADHAVERRIGSHLNPQGSVAGFGLESHQRPLEARCNAVQVRCRQQGHDGRRLRLGVEPGTEGACHVGTGRGVRRVGPHLAFEHLGASRPVGCFIEADAVVRAANAHHRRGRGDFERSRALHLAGKHFDRATQNAQHARKESGAGAAVG